eukprot:TRINITY_DN8396_c0_g2_i1.p1 TRINITY_DN8396_c0_g2~~TRINITY_DN8396_c0_g2_i1.p1  ORF type:complete len:751 (+),score=136.61 TRINITY_DN8396_c0_g2_i1:81-2255(+)
MARPSLPFTPSLHNERHRATSFDITQSQHSSSSRALTRSESFSNSFQKQSQLRGINYASDLRPWSQGSSGRHAPNRPFHVEPIAETDVATSTSLQALPRLASVPGIIPMNPSSMTFTMPLPYPQASTPMAKGAIVRGSSTASSTACPDTLIDWSKETEAILQAEEDQENETTDDESDGYDSARDTLAPLDRPQTSTPYTVAGAAQPRMEVGLTPLRPRSKEDTRVYGLAEPEPIDRTANDEGLRPAATAPNINISRASVDALSTPDSAPLSMSVPVHLPRPPPTPKLSEAGSLSSADSRTRAIRKLTRKPTSAKRQALPDDAQPLQPVPPVEAVQSLTMHVVTWNMNDQEAPDSLHPLLFPAHHEQRAPVDLYAVGVQEGPISTDVIQLRVQHALGSEYVKVAGELDGPINIVIFVRASLTWLISSVETDTVATKMGGMIRTKGGVGVSLHLAGVRLLFINAHLTAHQEKVKERNADYITIRRSLQLPARKFRRDMDLNGTLTLNNTAGLSSSLSKSRDACVYHDVTIWMGDLNYRCDCARRMADYIVAQKQFDVLFAGDQLSFERAQGTAFADFQEAQVKFPPTFKYDVGTNTFDTSSKQRVPSWTDRILWRVSDEYAKMLKCNTYDSIATEQSSDHKPVYGQFRLALLSPATACANDEPWPYDARTYYYGNQAKVKTAQNRSGNDGEAAASAQPTVETIVTPINKPTLLTTINHKSAICNVM